MSKEVAFRPIYLQRNMGHGEARRRSLAECKYPLVALMDSDDICLSNRFEKQLNCFLENPELSIVGGQISEFVDLPENITGIRAVPEKHYDILEYMKKRCPMNQVTVMFRKADVEKAGGYKDWYCEEDYYLWLRMMENGCTFRNVPDILVNVRVGDAMASRRGGLEYFKSEAKLQKYMLDKGIISVTQYFYNVAIRFGAEVVVGDKLRQKLYSFYREDVLGKEYEIQRSSYEEGDRIINYPPFSVSMCVYNGDNAGWFETALNSVINQTVKPAEIVLVIDGPIPEDIKQVIKRFQGICTAV